MTLNQLFLFFLFHAIQLFVYSVSCFKNVLAALPSVLVINVVTAVVSFSGVYVAHYLQNVTPQLALGTELALQRNKQIPGGQAALVSLCTRYTGMFNALFAMLTNPIVSYANVFVLMQ